MSEDRAAAVPVTSGSVHIREYTQSDQKPLFRFIRGVHAADPHYFDIMQPSLKAILLGKASICASAEMKSVLCLRSGEIVGFAILTRVDRLRDYLQVAFLELAAGVPEALDLLLVQARLMARTLDCPKVLIGLNFHVNYGLGLQADAYDEAGSFGSARNPAYYVDWIEPLATEVIQLVSYKKDISAWQFPVDRRIMARASREYSVRTADFRRLEAEAALYTRLNNLAFSSHRFYYERRVEEDLELFRDFRAFLKPENLLFLEYRQEAVGFMLWYPDFAQLMASGEVIGLGTWLKYKFVPDRIDTFKVVEVGVVPEHQGKAGVMALMQAALSSCQRKFRFCESGWIMEGNNASLGFGERWGDSVYHRYKVFVLDA